MPAAGTFPDLDTSGPGFVRLEVANAVNLRLVYDEDLDRESIPLSQALDVMVQPPGATVQMVSVLNVFVGDGFARTVRLQLNTSTATGDTVLVSYNPTELNSDPIQDLHGNLAAELFMRAIFVDLLYSPTPPVYQTVYQPQEYGGGGPALPVRGPSDEDFDCNLTRDIESLDGANDLPTGMWSDGDALWILNNAASCADSLFAYDLADGERRAEQIRPNSPAWIRRRNAM